MKSYFLLMMLYFRLENAQGLVSWSSGFLERPELDGSHHACNNAVLKARGIRFYCFRSQKFPFCYLGRGQNSQILLSYQLYKKINLNMLMRKAAFSTSHATASKKQRNVFFPCCRTQRGSKKNSKHMC